MGFRDRLTHLRKAFGPGVPAAIQAGEAAAGMDHATPFSPGTPIGPYDGYSRVPRTQNFVTGHNIAARPRSRERVSFETLRGLVESYDVASIAIWHRIDAIRALGWSIVAAPGFHGDASDAIKRATTIVRKPDRRVPFNTWIAKWLWDVLAYDAGCLYRVRNRRNDVIGMRPIDGTLVAPLLDYHGNTPEPPAEAYVQYANGLPWNWLTANDLVYQPFRPRTSSPYGTAPLETVLLSANTDLRFQAYFLSRFTDGNIPEAFAAAPEGWTPSQIEQFQSLWDAMLQGDVAVKHQIKWMPGGSKITWSNEKDFDDRFSLFLMRKVLAAYHVTPASVGFTENVNKSSGDSQSDVQENVGDSPLASYVEDILSEFLQDDCHLPVVFQFDSEAKAEDRLKKAQTAEIGIKSGMISPDEGREDVYGLPADAENPTPRFFMAGQTPTPLSAIGAPAATDPETFTDEQPAKPESANGAKPEIAPPARQPEAVAKDDAPSTGGPTAGITADTGIYSYDLAGRRSDEDDDCVVRKAGIADAGHAHPDNCEHASLVSACHCGCGGTRHGEMRARVRLGPIRVEDVERRAGNVRLESMTDDELAQLFARFSTEQQWDSLTVVDGEMQRREDGAQWVTNPNVDDHWDTASEPTEQDRKIDALLAKGYDFQEAFAEVFGGDAERMRQEERSLAVDRITGEATDAAVRRNYDMWVHEQYVNAETATRGHMLTAEAQRQGIQSIDLFSGPTSRARKWASEDLQRWWADNPRRTFTEYRAQALGRARDIAAAERTRLSGNDKDFI